MSIADLETLNAGEQAPGSEPADGDAIAGKSPTRIALERLRHDKVAIACSIVVGFFVLIAIFGPLIANVWGVQAEGAKAAEFTLNGYPTIGPPDHGFIWSHPFGIDPTTGNDLFARWLYGARLSLGLALIATVGSTLIGIALGLIAGFSRGWLDRVISFITDTFLAFPFLLGAIAVTPIISAQFSTKPDALLRAQIGSLALVLTLFGWMGLARLIRGQVLSLREREFVQAAQVIGVPTWQILYKELLPNLIAPIVISISLGLPAFIGAEAGLSYLGIGITGAPSWGQTINKASQYFDTYPLFLWPSVIAVALLVLTLNLLGDSVRDAFDPKTRR